METGEKDGGNGSPAVRKDTCEGPRNHHKTCGRPKERKDAMLMKGTNEWKPESALTEGLFLVHYCHPRCKPFQNILRLPKEEAFALAEKLARENPEDAAFGRFADFANYYPRRLETDAFLYENFLRLGGKPRERHPLSFVLQGSGYLENWFGNGPSYRIRLSEIPPDGVSFTLGDSCAQYERTDAIRQLTLEQLLARMEGFPNVEAFLEEAAKPYSYIEAQLWDGAVIESRLYFEEWRGNGNECGND